MICELILLKLPQRRLPIPHLGLAIDEPEIKSPRAIKYILAIFILPPSFDKDITIVFSDQGWVIFTRLSVKGVGETANLLA